MGQIKVTTTGDVGVGTNSPTQKLQVNGHTHISGNLGLGIANPTEKLHVAGNAYVTANMGIGTAPNSTQRLRIAYNGAEFVFCPSNKTDGLSYFGTKNNKESNPWINFYHPSVGYNRVRFSQSILSSDSTLKSDINILENVTPILKQIKTYSYYYKADSTDRKRDYGVLAQEVIKILPELVDTCMEVMFVNYNAFIGILITGFKEQQTLIEQQQNKIDILQKVVAAQEADIIKLKKLQEELDALQGFVYECCGKPKGGSYTDGFGASEPLEEKAILYQNTPNPFTSNTEITCYLPEDTRNAVIYIYNLQGVELNSYPLTQTGLNAIIVNGSMLPAGMYLYTLVVNNAIVDTKRMILTK